jgi:S-adenosylmethionine:tRNA-ribosyltransferase-isomerase (queuine synthetase)
VTLIERLDEARWKALARPAKRLKVGDLVRFGGEGRICYLDMLDATIEARAEGGEVTLAFAFAGAYLDQAIAERGDMPLPPYIAGRRPADERDREDYQTVFARREGAVAAPTAGLHFTDRLLADLAGKGIERRVRDPACRRRHLSAREGGGYRPIACMANGARWRPKPRSRSMPRGPRAAASWRSEPRP